MKKRRLLTFIKYLSSGIALFGISFIICFVTQMFLMMKSPSFPIPSKQFDVTASIIDGAVGAIAAGLILYELHISIYTEERQGDIEEAQFLLEYNQTFIQDKNMAMVEHELEMWMEKSSPRHEKMKITDENRQQFINYLVYLEGIPPLIFRDILKLEHIDDLMAYRFFLAVNNRELQEDQLFRYADYYRGCFKLYSIWKDYRIRQNYPIPLLEYSLDRWIDFEKYSDSPVSVRRLTLNDNLKKVAGLIYDTDPFIYPAAFGNKRRARNILPKMMKQPCIFHIDNIRVAEIKKKIVGIAVIVDASSHLEPPSVDSQHSSEGFVDARNKYFSAVSEAVSSIQNSAHLMCLCVDSRIRGQRVGAILLKNVIQECKERGLAAVTLDTLEDNIAAVRLYQDYGFKKAFGEPGYAFDEEALWCLRMVRNLTDPDESDSGQQEVYNAPYIKSTH